MNPLKKDLILAAGVIALYGILLVALILAFHAHGRTLQDFSVGHPYGDTWEYMELGRLLAERGTFSLDGENPNFFRTPGYPLVTAIIQAFGGSFIVIIILQIILVAFSAVLIRRIGSRLGPPWIGLAAAVYYVIDPMTILTAFMTMSDTLFVFILLLCVYLAMHGFRSPYLTALLLGALGGYLALVRPIGEFIVPIFAVWLALRLTLWSGHTEPFGKRLFVRGLPIFACVIIAASAVMGPWMLRNYVLQKHLALASVGPYNFLFYNIDIFNMYQAGGEQLPRDKTPIAERVGAPDIASAADFTYTERILEVTREELEGRLPAYIIFHIWKMVPYYLDSSYQTSLQMLHQYGALSGNGPPIVSASLYVLQGKFDEAMRIFLMNPFTLVERFFWAGVVLLSALALFLSRGTLRVTLIFFALLALAFGVLTGPVSYPRYRLPAEPFLLLGAATGAALLLAWLRATYRNKKTLTIERESL